MLRKLLAILVLVTGLAAAGTPAHARIFAAESVRAADVSYACTAPVGTHQEQLASSRQRDEAEPKSCPKPPKIVVIVPTVMLQADRARE